MDDHITPRRVVILGGGFAGLFAVRALLGWAVVFATGSRRERAFPTADTPSAGASAGATAVRHDPPRPA